MAFAVFLLEGGGFRSHVKRKLPERGEKDSCGLFMQIWDKRSAALRAGLRRKEGLFCVCSPAVETAGYYEPSRGAGLVRGRVAVVCPALTVCALRVQSREWVCEF